MKVDWRRVFRSRRYRLLSACDGLLVQRNIFPGGCSPGKITTHSVHLELVPELLILEHLDGAVDARRECGCRGIDKRKAVARVESLRVIFVPIVHRVGQSASLPDNGNCAVTEAVHLIEPAWFIARGHQEQ